MHIIKKFWHNAQGNIAMLTGILAIPLFMAGGISFDYAIIYRAEKALQSAADSAALASARELGLANTSDTTITQIAQNYVDINLTKDLGLTKAGNKVTVNTKISSDRKDVSVELAYYWKPILTQYISSKVLPLKVLATASLIGNQTICVIALDGVSANSLAMVGKSSIEANDCAIYSNSNSPAGIYTVNGASLSSADTYSAGGYQGPISTYKPAPVTDSPVIEDPLKDRARPIADNSCDNATKKTETVKITKGIETLYPGTYCGGISLTGKSNVKLKAGIYIMKDGPLSVNGNATLKGENVGFVFEGHASVFDFGVSTQVNLSAPQTGAMAGILFFEDRSAPLNRNFVIRSKDAEQFEGTVYLPNGRLVVDKASRVGQLSNWTAIIARQIEIRNGPELVINSDYAQSDIPVPDGISPNGTEVRLSR